MSALGARALEGGFGSWQESDLRPAVVVLHDGLMGGATTGVVRAVPILRDHGWRCAFWVPTPGSAFDWLKDRGAEVSGEPKPIATGLRSLREPPGLRRRLRATPGYLRRFREFLFRAQPQLVHANSLFAFAEGVAAHRAGHAALLHLHDMAPANRKRLLAAAIAERGFDHAIAASGACARSYARGVWQPEVVYEAAPVPERVLEPRERPKRWVVGSIGVISHRKGSDVFVAAARRLLQKRDDIEFRLVGSTDDPLEREWGEVVINDAVEAGIHHQRRVNVPSEIAGWDLFAMPSRTDPCPIVLLEAMASGLPVIGAASDGIVEQITPESGLLVPSEDPAALAAAIERVLSMPAAERAAMGRAAHERVKRVFDLDTQAAALDAAWRVTIDRHRAHLGTQS